MSPGVVRLLTKIEARPGECWLFVAGARDEHGYGRFWHDGRMTYAHIASYEMFVGPVPDDLVLDHLCHVRPCVNPTHLRAISRVENSGSQTPSPFVTPWKWSDADIAQMREMKEAGRRIREIGAVYGISGRRVQQLLAREQAA